MTVRKITQIRYYSENNPKNSASNVSFNRLVSGSLFHDKIPIVQLGIQTLPGTKFYLNNSATPVIVGSTGIYELEIDGLAEITSLRFDAQTLNLISTNDSAFLIVDIMYKAEEA